MIDLKNLKQEMELGKVRATIPPVKVREVRRNNFSKYLIVGLGLLVVVSAAMVYMFRSRIWPPPGNAAGPITLAILPFYPLNAVDEIGFLSTGLPDGIITRLANVHQIRVRPTSAILRYEGQKVSAQGVGRELASDYVVMGTVQKVGDRLRVNVQLVRTSDETTALGRFSLIKNESDSFEFAGCRRNADR